MLPRILLCLVLLGIDFSLATNNSSEKNCYKNLEIEIQFSHLPCGGNRKLLQSPSNSPPGNSSSHSPSAFRSPRTIFLTIIAGVSGFIAVGIITALIVFFAMWPKKLYRHFRNKRHRSPETRIVVPLRTHEESVSFVPGLPAFSMSALMTATNNFDKNKVIGDGGFGLVYKAVLTNGKVVAVKKLSMDACQGIREFQAEMETLGQIHHRNLVEILGHCTSGRERLIIYRFVENGSLDEWLHEREDVSRQLDWKKRVKIIRGVAEGLAFLHHDCQPHIIHRDIKGSNILLDNNFQAHITDFGLARNMNPQLSHISTQAAGTLGYMPPEYASGSIATMKADVYSFGMLMLEIATGRRPNLHVKDTNRRTLRNWVHALVKEGNEMELLDASLRESLADQQHSEEKVVEFFRIGCLCTDIDPQKRPFMRDVVSILTSLSPEEMN
eukprot:Gb_03681 [translate_table: standard]